MTPQEQADDAREWLQAEIFTALFLLENEGGQRGRELAAEAIALAIESYVYKAIGVTRKTT